MISYLLLFKAFGYTNQGGIRATRLMQWSFHLSSVLQFSSWSFRDWLLTKLTLSVLVERWHNWGSKCIWWFRLITTWTCVGSQGDWELKITIHLLMEVGGFLMVRLGLWRWYWTWEMEKATTTTSSCRRLQSTWLRSMAKTFEYKSYDNEKKFKVATLRLKGYANL